jgi:acetoin utilization deacetylase AcuC-like enzyme
MNGKSGLRIGIVRDERYLEHKPGHIHPEHPNRLRAIYRMLDDQFDGLLRPVKPEPATLENLELVHTPAYIKKVLKTADHQSTSLAPDTPASAKSYLSAWLAVGGCLNGLHALLSGQCDVCFPLIRPPGHHALPDRAGGFCIFNNPGVTARYAIQHCGLKRILIIDWDIHHGNGLNDLFYEEKEVFYFSTHDTLLYPYRGDWVETGRGEGEGYTINIPIPRTLEDEDFFHLYRMVLEPLIRRYRPDLILVDAGFDAHRDDPIGRSRLTEEVFGQLTRLILRLRAEIDDPPLLFILEGGYDPRSLARSVREVFRVLTDKSAAEEPGADRETEKSVTLVEKARRIHAKYGVWTD